MKKIRRRYSVWLFMILITASAISQQISFNRLSVNDGLSQVSVNALAQDEFGRIWIGTRDGLNVYSGSEINSFRPSRGDTTSLLGYFVTDLIVDSSYLWVLTKEGVSHLNTQTLKFTNYPKTDANCILTYKNDILIGTQKGLYTLDITSGTFVPATNIFKDTYTINQLYTDSSGMLWIGTNNGLFLYNPARKNITKVISENTTAIYTDSKKQIWVGTADNGVFLFNNKLRSIKYFNHYNNNSIVNNNIRAIQEDTKGNIWIGTFTGLSIINNSDHSISNYQHEEDNKQSLSHNSIYSILKDKQGNMWLGTYFGGISYVTNDVDVYLEYPISNSKSAYGLRHSVIGKMLEDNFGNILIATEGGGLDYYNRESKVFKHYYKKENGSGLSGNNVKALAFINKNEVLIGTFDGGLDILNLSTNKIKSFPQSPYKTIEDIISYKDYFLLATNSEVIQFDPDTYSFSPFFTKKKHLDSLGTTIRNLFEDCFGNLWIGTEKDGLINYDSTSDIIKKYKFSRDDASSISGNNISCIYEDHKFRLWIGTLGGGLNLFDKKSSSFINYTMEHNGLASNFIQAIRESRYGSLWISCSKGLSRFDVESSKIYNYTQKNGLPLNELNSKALLLTKKGEVFVGGVDGLISFTEETILNRPNKFNIFFSSISINNKKVLPLDKTRILKKDLPFTKEITLKPNQNAFTINYASSNFITTNQTTYKYKLENFDSEWIKAGYKTSVTYTSLRPGKHVLQIQGLGGVEETVIDESQLVIHVLPPFYRSVYAIISYIVILVFILLWLKKNFENRLKLINQIKMEQNEKERIKALNKSKLNFFTNISHEFRTPLTLITGTLESALEHSKTKNILYNKLLTTYNNVTRLNNLITELLDFRKLESGKLKLKVSENVVNKFAEEIYLAFMEYAQFHKIQYTFTPLDANLSLWFDHTQMEKVFYNIISNAFKYVSDKTGSIDFKIINNSNYIDFIITDNGLGIPKEKAEQIFDPYYQVDNLHSKPGKHSSGIGLSICKSIIKEHHGDISIESKEGKGTSFIVSLKKDHMHFNETDLIDNQALVKEKTKILPLQPEAQSEDIETDIDLSENTPSLLIVEDNIELLNLLKDILQPTYKIHTAIDGNEGFNKAIELQPDLILSDVMMPNLSGTEMCIKLKRNIQTSHIPIILLTAQAAVKYKIKGLDTGADDYITKPFNINLLKARIKNIIHNRILIQQKFKQDPTIEIKELTNNTNDADFLEKVNAILEKNIDNSEFDVQDFAREMGVGRTKLYAKIKGITGQTANDFILSTRLKKAAQMLLAGGELNISEIAYSVGFSTPRYFSKCFRDHFGVSPSSYGKKSEVKS